MIDFQIDDIFEMKKKHPCGSNKWKVIKVGAELKIKCEGCGHEIIIKRSLAEKNTKKVQKNVQKNVQKK